MRVLVEIHLVHVRVHIAVCYQGWIRCPEVLRQEVRLHFLATALRNMDHLLERAR